MKKINALKACCLLALLGLFSQPLMAADIAAGKAKAAACAGCHGATGISVSEEFPNLAGQKAAYLEKQLKAFKSGTRSNATMKAMTAALNNQDIANLAAYFSSLSHKPVSRQTKAIAGDHASPGEFPENVFVSIKKGKGVVRFPDATFWAGGPNMLYEAITPDQKRLLVTSPSTDQLYVFDTQSGKQQAIIKVGKAPKGVKVSPDGREAYVSNQGSNEISVIDLSSLKNIATIKTPPGPHNARFTADGKTAYVTLQGGAGLGVIDTRKRQVVKVIPLPGITGPHNLDLSKDEKTAFVRDFVHHVAVVDLLSGKVKKVITVGNGHGGIDVIPNGHYAATAAIGDDYVSLIDTHNLKLSNIKVGNGPHGIRASADSHWLYVTVTKDNVVAVIDLHSLKLVKKIRVGDFPFWVAVAGNP